MIEPLRSQYLAALGIENYVPRFVLPGAKASMPCAWLEAPAAVAPAPAALIGEGLVDDAASSAETTVPPQSARAEVRRAPVVEQETRRPVRAGVGDTAAAKAPPARTAAGPQFALSIVLAGGGLLLIDSAPASNAERTAFQTLLNNMLPALRPAAAQYVLDIFLWPLTRQPKIPRDADAARETLAAYLHKQIQQRAIDTVLLLGEAAQQWCALADVEVKVVNSISLLACVHDPALKRPLWNDIRHLAER